MRPAEYTKLQERLRLRTYFASHPHLRELFGAEWISGIVSPFLTRDEAPPILWTLLNAGVCERLTESLELLSAQRNIGSIIRDLKSKDRENVLALVSELEVFRTMRKAGTSVVWKPPSQKGRKGKAPDLAVTHSDQGVLVEVFTVTEASRDTQKHGILVPLDRAIGQMMNHSYVVDYDVVGELRTNDVARAIAFVKRAIGRLRAAGEERAELVFNVGPRRLLRLKFQTLAHGKRGHHGIAAFRMTRSIDAGRIKAKLLDKLDRFQFQEGEDVKGYVIVLSALTADEHDVADALLGKGAAEVTGDQDAYVAKPTRQANGVIADVVRGKRLLDEVDFIVALIARRSGSPRVAAIFVNDDRRRISPDEVTALFGEVRPPSDQP